MKSNLLSNFLEEYKPFVVGLVFAVVLVILRFLVGENIRRTISNNDLVNIQNFIQWLGILYGIFIGILLQEAYKFNDHSGSKLDDLEAIIWKIIRETLVLPRGKLKIELLKSIYTLVGSIESLNSLIFEKTKNRPFYFICQIATSHYKFVEDMDKLLLSHKNKDSTSALTSLLYDLVIIVREINTISRSRFPSILWILAIVFSFIWIIPFLVFHFYNELVSMFLVGGASFVMVSILVIIRELWGAVGTSNWFNIDGWRELLSSEEQSRTSKK